MADVLHAVVRIIHRTATTYSAQWEKGVQCRFWVFWLNRTFEMLEQRIDQLY